MKKHILKIFIKGWGAPIEKPIFRIQDHIEKWKARGFSGDGVGFRSPLLESDHSGL